jgi:hypothetical protein
VVCENHFNETGGRMLKRSLICCALAIVLVNLAFAQSQADKEKALTYLESTRQGVIDATKGLSEAQ